MKEKKFLIMKNIVCIFVLASISILHLYHVCHNSSRGIKLHTQESQKKSVINDLCSFVCFDKACDGIELCRQKLASSYPPRSSEKQKPLGMWWQYDHVTTKEISSLHGQSWPALSHSQHYMNAIHRSNRLISYQTDWLPFR